MTSRCHEYYVPCDYEHFRRMVHKELPNQNNQYNLECHHLYRLYPSKEGSLQYPYYLHLSILPSCEEHLNDIVVNLRYMLDNPDLNLEPYINMNSKEIPRVFKNPFETWWNSFHHRGVLYDAWRYRLLLQSREVRQFEWSTHIHHQSDKNGIGIYFNLTTDLAEFHFYHPNFWTGSPTDLELALAKRNLWDNNPIQCLIDHLQDRPDQINNLTIKNEDQIEVNLLKEHLANKLHFNVIPIICDYYRQCWSGETLPRPRKACIRNNSHNGRRWFKKQFQKCRYCYLDFCPECDHSYCPIRVKQEPEKFLDLTNSLRSASGWDAAGLAAGLL